MCGQGEGEASLEHSCRRRRVLRQPRRCVFVWRERERDGEEATSLAGTRLPGSLATVRNTSELGRQQGKCM